MASPAIEVKNLTKVYSSFFGMREVLALDELNLEVNKGEIFGFIGPNGAGKTTTIKLLLGLLFPTAGECIVLGQKVSAKSIFDPERRSCRFKKEIGFLPEGPYFQEFLKGEEVLRFFGYLYGLRGSDLDQRVNKTLALVGMEHAANRLVDSYSKGMRQRIGLGQALISDPELLILDEPTVGLDPIARREIRDLLMRLREEGRTLLVCSHELTEIELISDRVGLIDRGKMKQCGRLSDFLYADQRMELRVQNLSEELKNKLIDDGCTVVADAQGTVNISVPTSSSVYDVIEAVRLDGVNLVSLIPQKETLENLFVRLVKE